MSLYNDEDDDEDILLYDSSEDGGPSGPSDDEDDDFVFLDRVKTEKPRGKRSVLGKRRRTCHGDSPSLLMSEDLSFGDEDSLLPSPLRPSRSAFKAELQDLDGAASDDSVTSDAPAATDGMVKRKKLYGAALRKRTAELREFRTLIRAISNKLYKRYHLGGLEDYPPLIDGWLGLKQCWPWEADHNNLPPREMEEIEVQQPLREDFPEVRSLVAEEPWKQIPLSQLDSTKDVPAPEEATEDGFMEHVRDEVANMTAKTFKKALSADPRAQELSENSASVQATATIVTEALEEVLKASLKLRGLVGPAEMLSSKVAGDWETVLNAGRCVGIPERVLERTRLRLYADRDKEELMQLSCFTELQWLPVPGGLHRNRFRPTIVRKPRGPNKKKPPQEAGPSSEDGPRGGSPQDGSSVDGSSGDEPQDSSDEI